MLRIGKKFSKPNISRVINGDLTPSSDPDPLVKERLDHLLVKKYPAYNRSTLQKFIKFGYVQVDRQTIKKANFLIDPSAIITLHLPDFDHSSKRPPVIFENENVIVFNKPSGFLSMQKGEFSPEPSIADFGFPAHRLDRDTSGVIIVAKNLDTRQMLQRQFQTRAVKKTYLAITNHKLKTKAAKIDLPIARNLKRPTTFIVDPAGRPAVTFYRVLKETGNYTLVELKPLTGRTHQLRVHLNYLGAPILGDRFYHGEPASRLFLHASSLEITIPDHHQNIRKTFSAPLPSAFYQFFPDLSDVR